MNEHENLSISDDEISLILTSVYRDFCRSIKKYIKDDPLLDQKAQFFLISYSVAMIVREFSDTLRDNKDEVIGLEKTIEYLKEIISSKAED